MSKLQNPKGKSAVQNSKIARQGVRSLLIFLLVLVGVLAVATIGLAAPDASPPPPGAEEPIGQIDRILGEGKAGLSDFASRFHELSSIEPGADAITSLIFFAIDFLKYLLGGIAVIYMIITGVKLIGASKQIDEVSEKQKESLKFIIYGLILVIIADELVTKVFFGQYGECIASASNAKSCAQAGGGLIKGIYSFILAVMASVAIFVLVVSAFRFITSYGNEETINKQKKRITMAIIGLLVSGVGEFVVKGIVFPEAGQKGIDVVAAQKLVFNFTNFIAAFIGAAAFAMFFYGGYLYVISAGNDEKTGKAKKIIVSAIIGIVIAFAAFGIVATVSRFSSGREVNLPRQIPGLSGGK